MIDIKNILQTLDIPYKDKGKNVGINDINIDCPFCGATEHLGIHMAKGYVNCWVCQFDGLKISLVNVLCEVTGLPYNQIKSIIQDNSSDEFTDAYQEIKKTRQCRLPNETQPILSVNKSMHRDRALKYLLKRNITRSHIYKYNLQFCSSGMYKGRIIIPIYNKGKLVNYIGRSYTGSETRYKNCLVTNCSKRLTEVFFNWDNVIESQTKHIRIVEGVFDAMTLDDNITVSLCRSNMSPCHYKALVDYRPDTVTISLDYNAYSKALHIAENLGLYIPKINLVRLTESLDINELGKDRYLQLESQ